MLGFRARRRTIAALCTTLLATPIAAHALVTIPTQGATVAQLSTFSLDDLSSEGCDAFPSPAVCQFQATDTTTLPLATNPAGDLQLQHAVPAYQAELDQSYAVAWSFEDTPLGETLTGGSVSVTSAARGIAAPLSDFPVEGAAVVGLVEIRFALEVSAPVFLYVFGNVALSGGPIEPRTEVATMPSLLAVQNTCLLNGCAPWPEVRILRPGPGGLAFQFNPQDESAMGAFDSGELVLEPGLHTLLVLAGSMNAVPIVPGAPETHLVQTDLDLEFAIVPVPAPGALTSIAAAIATLCLLRARPRSPPRWSVYLACAAHLLPAAAHGFTLQEVSGYLTVPELTPAIQVAPENYEVGLETRVEPFGESGPFAADSAEDTEPFLTLAANCPGCEPGIGSATTDARASGFASFGMIGGFAEAEVAGSGWYLWPADVPSATWIAGAQDSLRILNATATIEMRFADTLVLAAPELEGQPGTATFSMVFDGSWEQFEQDAPSPLADASAEGGTGGSFVLQVRQAVASIPVAGPGSGSQDQLVSVTAPIVIGTPFLVEARLSLEADAEWEGNPYTTAAEVYAGGAELDYDGTARWAGITDVRDASGNLIPDWVVSAESGTDYRDPFPAPAPSSSLCSIVAWIALGRLRWAAAPAG
jgi:hypothetical protein